MLLTAEQKKFLAEQYSIHDPEQNLGTVIRRLCAFPKADGNSWLTCVHLVNAIARHLETHAQQELTMKNSKGLSVLDYALNSLLSYAQQIDATRAELYYRLQMGIVLACYLPVEELSLENVIAKYRSKQYFDDPNLIHSTCMLFGPEKLQKVEICIKALEYVFSTIKNNRLITKLANLQDSEGYTGPTPIVLLYAHIDNGISELMHIFGADIANNNYGVACLELQMNDTANAFIKRFGNTPSFHGQPLIAPKEIQIRDQLHVSLIEHCTKNRLKVKFVDPVPLCKPEESFLLNYLFRQYHLLNLIRSLRESGMVQATKFHSMKQTSGALLFSGVNHYQGLNKMFAREGITPRFILVTKDMAFLRALPSEELKVPFDELLSYPDVSLIDMSKASKNAVLEALGLRLVTSKPSLTA